MNGFSAASCPTRADFGIFWAANLRVNRDEARLGQILLSRVEDHVDPDNIARKSSTPRKVVEGSFVCLDSTLALISMRMKESTRRDSRLLEDGTLAVCCLGIREMRSAQLDRKHWRASVSSTWNEARANGGEEFPKGLVIAGHHRGQHC